MPELDENTEPDETELDETEEDGTEEDETEYVSPSRMSPGKKLHIWFVVILVLALAVFLAGVHLGARGDDSWYTNLVMWVAQKLQ